MMSLSQRIRRRPCRGGDVSMGRIMLLIENRSTTQSTVAKFSSIQAATTLSTIDTTYAINHNRRRQLQQKKSKMEPSCFWLINSSISRNYNYCSNTLSNNRIPLASVTSWNKTLGNNLTSSNGYGNGNINGLLDSNPGPVNPLIIVNQHCNVSDSRFYYSTSHSRLSSTSTSSFTMSDEERALIKDLARNSQTSVSLQKLISTGLGEYLHKTFGDDIIASSTSSKVMMGSTSSFSSTTTTDQNITPEKLVLIQVASFLRRELPIRLAHRIEDLESIPVLRDMEHVVLVRNLYIQSCLDIVRFDNKISTVQQEQEFSLIIEKIYERHNSVLVQMARGAYEFRKTLQRNQNNTSSTSVVDLQDETNEFLDRFYLCRIGIRVLIGQYLALRQPPVENYIGIVCSRTSPYEIVKRAIDDAAFMCTRKYGEAPEVIMSGRLDLTFPYVPTHLHYIMLELIKNSMRATVEWHGVDNDFPPIKVIIADGQENEDIVIKVSDEGGGIPRSNIKKIWSYLFTTADPAIQDNIVGTNMNQIDHGTESPLAGLGYGLPISRSYCRYFGGDLSIMSMEGYGTDAFVYLTRLGDTREPLPI